MPPIYYPLHRYFTLTLTSLNLDFAFSLTSAPTLFSLYHQRSNAPHLLPITPFFRV